MTLAERYMNKSYLRFDEEMARRFVYARKRMKLDQKELGRLLGVSQYQISRLETGKSDLSPFNVGRMRAVMRKHADFIMTGEGSQHYPGYQPLKKERQNVDDFDV